jgi:hypothetical protein
VAERSKDPRFNHVAMSLPAAALGPNGRDEIVRFYGDVFGWEELPQMTEDGRRLVLMAYRYGQFVFLVADDTPMAAPRGDHFGMQVATMEELEEFLARARAYRENDDRVEVTDKEVEDFGPLVLTSFYVRFLLPLMVEVQHYEVKPEARAAMAG